MTYKLHFFVGELPDLTNRARKFSSWQKSAGNASRWKRLIEDKVTQHGRPPSPLQKAKVTLIRHSSREPDYDGLVSSFKVVLDALVKASVIIDDNSKVIGIPEYLHAKITRNKSMIEIICEEVNQE